MAENITTLLDMDDAENISGDDYLYLVQGSGSKRDRKVRLGDIFANMEGWKRFTQYGETQNFELGEWDGDSVIMARPLISKHSSVYPSSITVSQSQASGISIVVAELTDDGSCTLTYGSETATLHVGEIAILYSFYAVGYAIFRISVIPSAAFGIFKKLKVDGETILPGATFTPATSSGSVPVTKISYLNVLESLHVDGETILPGATFTPATSSGAVPVAKISYLNVLESLDVEKGMTVKGKAEFESVNADSLEVGTAKASDMKTGSIISGRFKLPKEGDAPYQNISADCFHDTDSDYTLDGGVGSIEYVYNSGTEQIKVFVGSRVEDGLRLYVNLNSGCCGGFICVSSWDSGRRFAPMFNAVVQVES